MNFLMYLAITRIASGIRETGEQAKKDLLKDEEFFRLQELLYKHETKTMTSDNEEEPDLVIESH